MPDQNSEAARDPIALVVEMVERDRAAQIGGERLGRPSVFTCPECDGTLWQVSEPELIQFRCHVGHTMTGELLLAEQAGAAENSLWRTIRMLTDQMVLSRELAEFARRNGQAEAAGRFEARARNAGRQAQTLRQVAETPPADATPADATPAVSGATNLHSTPR